MNIARFRLAENETTEEYSHRRLSMHSKLNACLDACLEKAQRIQLMALISCLA